MASYMDFKHYVYGNSHRNDISGDDCDNESVHALSRSTEAPDTTRMEEDDDVAQPSPYTDTTTESNNNNNNILLWLASACPTELVPQILAFAGPQTVASLASVNRQWHRVVMEDENTVWQVLCEEYGKCEPGQDSDMADMHGHGYAASFSWKDYYCHNPVVPTDFRTVQRALDSLLAVSNENSRQIRRRVLVRPGCYHSQEEIHFHDTTENPQLVTIEQVVPKHYNDNRSSNSVVTLTLPGQELRDYNMPLLWVSRGELLLKGIHLQHYSKGRNIDEGNAAVHVEPSFDGQDTALLRLEQCVVTSASGCGVVVRSGGRVGLQSCTVQNCASAGIALDGKRSQVQIQQCNITRNGQCSHWQHGGGVIVRGNPGMHLESGGNLQGSNSNVSVSVGAGIHVLGWDMLRGMNLCNINLEGITGSDHHDFYPGGI